MDNNNFEDKKPEPIQPYGSDFDDAEDTQPFGYLPDQGKESTSLDDFKGYGQAELLEKSHTEADKQPEEESTDVVQEETGAWFAELERFNDADRVDLPSELIEPFNEDTGFFEGHWTKTESPLKPATAQMNYQERS